MALTSTEYSVKIVNWMNAHGHPSYRNEIIELEATKSETIGEAGRYWQDCEFTMGTVRSINKQIEEVYQAACERYEDWASD